MKTIKLYRFLFLFALLAESCTPYDLGLLMPEGSADVVNQVFYGPSYGNSPTGSGRETSKNELDFNFGLLGIVDFVGLLVDDGTASIDTEQPAYGSLLASNKPGFLAGNYRPYRPARPKADAFVNHLAFMTGLEIVGKGGKQSDVGGTEKTRLLYLELPIYVVYHHDLADNKGRIFGGLGPYFAYGLSGSFKSTFNGQTFSNPAFGDNGGFKRFDAGLALTAGYQFPSSLRIRLAYDLGLATINSGPSGPDYDKTHNRALSVNVGYPLNKIVNKFKKK